MEKINTSRHNNRSSPSSERFLGLFSQNPNNNRPIILGDEFQEDDVFWTGNFTESDHNTSSSTPSLSNNHINISGGIMSALKQNSGEKNRLLCRKISLPSSSSSTSTSSSSSRMIPTIPKRQNSTNEKEYYNKFMSAPVINNIRHSAPVNVPVRPKVVKRREGDDYDYDDDDDSDKEMLPPHEIVARSSKNNQSEMTFSVLEGVGRTLKGRDLRQVRNTVWRQTGFLD
ncbi:hypothetical protein IFM89_028291 [Coptis chinensis]|uniref:Senescence regulator n=1 Tax=Coptis chinensis TaxID=261450 RepID=A0A835HHX6_9MAGN|nr:hypothetical protein IFM89_028291 [Coptis chinensis]